MAFRTMSDLVCILPNISRLCLLCQVLWIDAISHLAQMPHHIRGGRKIAICKIEHLSMNISRCKAFAIVSSIANVIHMTLPKPT